LFGYLGMKERQLLIYLLLWCGIVVICPLVTFSQNVETEKVPFTIPKNSAELPQKAVIETNKGSFEIELFRDWAPITVKNFEYLAAKGFYNGLTFHNYREGYILEGGDPKGTGEGGTGWTLPAELSNIQHHEGIIGMLRLPNQVNPERRSNGSQFYICLAKKARHLDGLYTVFGRVVSGMGVVRKLRKDDKILGVQIIGE